MISVDEVLKIAKLARLHVEDAELPKLQKKFSDVVALFEKLESFPTEGVEPLYHAVDAMPLRDDVSEPSLATADLLKNAPDAAGDCFHIPRVVAAGE